MFRESDICMLAAEHLTNFLAVDESRLILKSLLFNRSQQAPRNI